MLHKIFSRAGRAQEQEAPTVVNAPPQPQYVVPQCHPRELAYAFNGLLLGRADAKANEALSAIESRVSAEVQHLLVKGLRPSDVPRLPSTIPQLLDTLERQAHAREIAAIINRDPALAAEVVSLANSPIFRRSREPAKTVESAFAHIGENGIRTLLIAAGMRPMFEIKTVYFRLFGRLLWQHAFDCAHACATLAPKKRIDPSSAFFAGLIHDVGKLVVFQRTLAAFCTAAPDAPLRPAVFQALIEEFAGKLTLQICDNWRIPRQVRDAIAQQSDDDCPPTPLGRLLFTANALAETHMLITERALAPDLLKEHLRTQGIPWSALYEPFPQHRETQSAPHGADQKSDPVAERLRQSASA